MTRTIVLAAALFAASVAAASAQDLAAGEQSFKKCLPCHSIGPGATNKVGPEQNGLDGRKAGTTEGYNYTDANKNSGIVWGEEVFKEYITDPRAKIPGTKMVFAGIKNENERNNLWAYLKQFNADGSKKP
jgi:cytochrome c